MSDTASRHIWKARQHFAVTLSVIAVAAFASRMVYISIMPVEQKSNYDQLFFKAEAQGLADGRGFELPREFGLRSLGSGEHPPLTALVLTPGALLGGDSDYSMRIVEALIGTTTVVLIGLLGRKLAGDRAGLIAAVIAAVYPNLLVNDAILMPEALATMCTAAVALLSYRLIRRASWGSAAATGIACGCAMLARGELALLIPLLAVPVVLFSVGDTVVHRLRLLSVVALAAAITIAPWQGYMLARYKEPVFISYGDGGVLVGANCAPTYSGPWVGYWLGGLCSVRQASDPSVTAARGRDQGLRYARAHVRRLAAIVIPARIARLWSWYKPFRMARSGTGEGRPYAFSLGGLYMLWILSPLAVLGALRLRRRRVPITPLVAPVVIVTLVAAAFYGLVRFRAPAEVSIVVLAAVALDSLTARRAATARQGSQRMQEPAGEESWVSA
jgi:4-amino-4-deoxy-L-arabinose transferase-like glycosyltransferase